MLTGRFQRLALLGMLLAASGPVRAAATVGPVAAPAETAKPGPVHGALQAVATAGSRLVAVGAHGLIAVSDNGGAGWTTVPSPVPVDLTDVRFGTDHVGWIAGHDGVILRSEDGGESWTVVQDGARAAAALLQAAENGNDADSVRNARIAEAKELVASPSRPFVLLEADGTEICRAIGTGELSSETTDGGKTWRPWSDAIADPKRTPLYAMAERDGVMVLAGAQGMVLAGRAEDGLHALPSPGSVTLFGAAAMPDALLVFGQQGHAFVTTANNAALLAGKPVEWKTIADPSQTTLTAETRLPDGSLVLGDTAGMLWRVVGTNGDLHLVRMAGTVPFPILGLATGPGGDIVAVGSGGAVRLVPPPVAPAAQPN